MSAGDVETDRLQGGSVVGSADAELAASIASPWLRAVAPAVVTRCFNDLEIEGSEEDVRAAVSGVAAAVTAADPQVVEGYDTFLCRRVLELFRSELVARWCETGQIPTQGLSLLQGLENVSHALHRAGRLQPRDGLPGGATFVAGVAHDLRSPLTSILFLAETLLTERSGPVNDSQRRQLGIIYSAALGLVSVASDIIELVRGGDGLTERRPTLFSVTEMLESVHDIVRPMAEEKGIRVQLFPPSVDLRLGYPLALSRVLLNLTTNGLKFTDNGFVEIAVHSTGGARVEFSVRDTGKGFSASAIDDLYQPFRRSPDGRKYGFSGAGLGLAISRKLVAAMGSSLQVESRATWGTRFFFEMDLPPGPRDPVG
jgi:signal transduction histidine kinase